MSAGNPESLQVFGLFSNTYLSHNQIEKNVAALVEMPKLHQKDIIRLEPDEVAKLLDAAESGEHLSKRQMAFHQYTKTRDVAMLTLFLGTGIRISECVGLDIDDIDFNTDAFRVKRKGWQSRDAVFLDGSRTGAYGVYGRTGKNRSAAGPRKCTLFCRFKKSESAFEPCRNL